VLTVLLLQPSDMSFCNLLKGIAERPAVLCPGASVQCFTLLASVPCGDCFSVDDERFYFLALAVL
jgi:hypothetical protein